MGMTKKPLITVSILLKGDLLDPKVVSQTLGISADKWQKKGDIRPGSKTYIARTGAWWSRLDNKAREIQDISKEVPQLLDELRFQQRQEPLTEIAGVEKACVDILVLGDMEEELGMCEFLLNKGQILRASQLGLGVCLTTSLAYDD